MSKFSCTKCGSLTKVIESRQPKPERRRRRRQCYQCKYRFTTIETVYVKEKKDVAKVPRRYIKRSTAFWERHDHK